MADTFTTRVRAEKPEVGANDGTWGTELNANTFDMFDEAIAGVVSVAVAGSNITLSASNGVADEARNPVLILTGTPGAARTISYPDVEGWHWVFNNTDATQTINAGAGTSVSILSGWIAAIYTDGATNAKALLNLNATVGGQIVFPATQNASANANTLDDYEEGTFTPTFTASGVSGVTYSLQSGFYTKIGRIVHIEMRLTLSSKGSGGSGFIGLAGLPFTVADRAAAASIIYDFINLNAGYTQAQGNMKLPTTTMDVIELGDNVAAAGVTWANIANNTDFNIAGHYHV